MVLSGTDDDSAALEEAVTVVILLLEDIISSELLAAPPFTSEPLLELFSVWSSIAGKETVLRSAVCSESSFMVCSVSAVCSATSCRSRLGPVLCVACTIGLPDACVRKASNKTSSRMGPDGLPTSSRKGTDGLPHSVIRMMECVSLGSHSFLTDILH